jgi:hypothetical protein
MAIVINAKDLTEQVEKVLTDLWFDDQPIFLRFRGRVRGKLVRPTPEEQVALRGGLEHEDVPFRHGLAKQVTNTFLVCLLHIDDKGLYVLYLNHVLQQSFRGDQAKAREVGKVLEALGYQVSYLPWEQKALGWPPNNLYTAGLV